MSETVIRIPTLWTRRLTLRAPCIEDFVAFAEFRGSDRARSLGGPFTRPEAFQQLGALIGHWHLRGFGRWMVADRSTDSPLGVVGPFFSEGWPEPEIAWSIFASAEGRGLAEEAARAALDYAYDVLGWRTAISLIAPDNTRSIALARRLGAERDGDYAHATLGPLDVFRHPSPEMAA